MGNKRKRSRDSEFDKIAKKIKKLEHKLKRRRKISTSSESKSDSSDYQPVNMAAGDLNNASDLEQLDEIPDTHPVIQNDIEPPAPPADECMELNQDILEILGTDPSSELQYGENLHRDVASRWKHILVNGLSKEVKTELLKSYLPPENCNSKAPKLNLEIKAALSEVNLKKDLFSQSKQNQMSSCIAALGKALNVALSRNEQDIVKLINDASKILCDLHYRESQSRRYAIINTLNKHTKETVKSTKIDEHLFGADLAEQLKSSKAIYKSGTELRPAFDRSKSKQPVTAQPTNSRRGALNARGVSRQAAAESRAYPNQQRQPRARQHESVTSRTSTKTSMRGSAAYRQPSRKH